MAWETIAEAGSLDELQRIAPDLDIPHGREFRVVVTLSLPIAPFFDAWGAEQAVDMFYNQAGAILEDVEGVGWNTAILHFRANAVPLLAFIAVLTVVLAGVALIITAIRIDWKALADIPGDILASMMWPMAIATAVLGVALILSGKKKAA